MGRGLRTSPGVLTFYFRFIYRPLCLHTCVHHTYVYVYTNLYLSDYRAKHPTKVHVWAGISEKGATQSAFSKGRWTHPCTRTYSTIRCFRFWRQCIQPATDLCRIMILSIPWGTHRIFSARTKSTGGRRLPSHQISTQSKICGTSWRSTSGEKSSGEKSSHVTKTSWSVVLAEKILCVPRGMLRIIILHKSVAGWIHCLQKRKQRMVEYVRVQVQWYGIRYRWAMGSCSERLPHLWKTVSWITGVELI